MKIVFTTILTVSLLLVSAQGWKPAMEGLYPLQDEALPGGFRLKFKPNGPMGRDWIYGSYFDEDSLHRCVGYRQDGRWVSLPFSGYYGNEAVGLEMWGDTLYIFGAFGSIVLDKDSSLLPETPILKYYMDSIWTSLWPVFGLKNISIKGDTMLLWANYYNPPQIIGPHIMTIDNGTTWSCPYSIRHPTDTSFGYGFGAISKFKIFENGDILTLNNRSPSGDVFRGVSRWDGNQWHPYGNGIRGGRVEDFEFYNGDLIISGSFDMQSSPLNPGNGIARWDGNQWQQLSTGILEGNVVDIFVHDSLLFAHLILGNNAFHQFGDVKIANLAAWDGQKWCGTNLSYPLGLSPHSVGFANDTLYGVFRYNSIVNGDLVTYLNYFDGDYVNGPNAICSSYSGISIEEEKGLGISVFPLPADNSIKVSFHSQNHSILKYQIFDLNGQMLEKGNLEKGTIDVSRLGSGMYILGINAKDFVRFVRE